MENAQHTDKSNYHVLLPLGDLEFAGTAVAVAQALARGRAGRVTALCIVDVAEEKSLSEGAIEARRRRQMLAKLPEIAPAEVLDIRTMVRVSHNVWQGINEVAQEEGTDLLLLPWKGFARSPEHIFGRTIDEIMASPPCDVAVFKPGALPERPQILVPVRGGPYAELALGLSEALAHVLDGQVTVMHAVSEADMVNAYERGEQPFRELMHRIGRLPRLRRVVTARGQPMQAILNESVHHDLVVMGASAVTPDHPGLGPVTENVAQAIERPMIIVKTKQTMGALFTRQPSRPADLSTMVDKWFAENTFHAREFRDVSRLVELKERQGLTISLGLPALNEEATVGKIIRVIKQALMEEQPLLDEIVLIDSGSTDRTVHIAQDLGVPTCVHQEILPEQGAHVGKGEALWKSLHVLKGDIIAWIDTDIRNIHPKFVYGIVGPLLREPRLKFVKGFYRRPLRVAGEVQSHGGGRVTELTARPLFNLFYPALSGIIQPLSGEYAGRREVLERVPFFTGYGVEAGMLIDILESHGIGALAQVDLQERIHRNQTLAALSRMSFTIIQVVIARLEERHRLRLLEDINRSMKMIHYEADSLHLQVRDLYDIERPPIMSVREYRQKRNVGESGTPGAGT